MQTKNMKNEVVVASGNAGKLKEFQEIFRPFDIQVIGQKTLSIPEAEETGATFVENAILKARNAAKHSGKPALADDSGLEVDALNGSPGIYSARYAGLKASDADNVNKLLVELNGNSQRKARFQCVIVYLRHEKDPTPLICQGTWEGVIAHQPQGVNGFGYDPVFFIPQQQCTAAELPSELKNRLSHRGQALNALITTLNIRPV